MSSVPLLLADPSPNLRLLVLRELLDRKLDDEEVGELIGLRDQDPMVRDLLSLQENDGSWSSLGDPRSRSAGRQRSTVYALIRLGYLGAGADHPAVRRGVKYLLSLQLEDGSWPMGDGEDSEDEGYSMIPTQTSLPLRGLASCGYARDPRAEKAYHWLLDKRLPDGAWPTGISSGNLGGVAGYRRLPHSRWGCRTNTTAAAICLSLHPERRHSPEARRALDMLLARETRERNALGYETARITGVERIGGNLTHHARFDLGLLLDLCWRIGATTDDERVSGILDYLRKTQGPHGLWEYQANPRASRWITFDLLRSLSRLDRGSGWVSLEPRTPFRAYPRKARRY